MTKSDRINNEAIYELRYQDDMRKKGIPYQVSNLSIITAISALEKQIPKKPLNPCGRYFGKAKGGNCPCCGAHINSLTNNYCRKCGQKLDWSDTE